MNAPRAVGWLFESARTLPAAVRTWATIPAIDRATAAQWAKAVTRNARQIAEDAESADHAHLAHVRVLRAAETLEAPAPQQTPGSANRALITLSGAVLAARRRRLERVLNQIAERRDRGTRLVTVADECARLVHVTETDAAAMAAMAKAMPGLTPTGTEGLPSRWRLLAAQSRLSMESAQATGPRLQAIDAEVAALADPAHWREVERIGDLQLLAEWGERAPIAAAARSGAGEGAAVAAAPL